MLRSLRPTFTLPFASFPPRKNAGVVSGGVPGKSGRFHGRWLRLMRSTRRNRWGKKTKKKRRAGAKPERHIEPFCSSSLSSTRFPPQQRRLLFATRLSFSQSDVFFRLSWFVATVRREAAAVRLPWLRTDRRWIPAVRRTDGQMRATLSVDPPLRRRRSAKRVLTSGGLQSFLNFKGLVHLK